MSVWNKNTGTIKRPILRYYGGKWNIAPFIIEHMPPHTVYCEPYGGGGSVLLRKPRADLEIYNDLLSEMVNVFHHLRDPRLFGKLKKMLLLTPYSRDEYELSYLKTANKLEQARRTLTRSGLGHGAMHMNRTGFRGVSASKKKYSQGEWESWKTQLDNFHNRLKGVVVENIDAITLILKNDRPDTLLYVDPPYTKSSIAYHDKSKYYKHELTDDAHVQLASVLRAFSGMVIISGYDSEIYRDLYPDWQTNEVKAFAQGNVHGKTARVERIWMNQRCVDKLIEKRMFFELTKAV